MSQHPIDLLPDSIRASCRAGVRTGRYIAAMVAGVVLVVIATTHARLDLERTRERLARAEEQANLVLQLEAQANQLEASLSDVRHHIQLQERLGYPFEISRVLATIINQLPESITLERIELDTAPRRMTRGSRRGTDEGEPSRVCAGEIAGFAVADEEIAELVAQLQASDLFQSVNLDYSRSRIVRDRSAREFRLSFRIDLDQRYLVNDDDEAGAAPEEELTHVR